MISIPETEHESLAGLAALNEHDFQALTAAVAKVEPSSATLRPFSRALPDDVADRRMLARIVRMAVGMRAAADRAQKPVASGELTKDVARDAARQNIVGADVADQLSARLQVLLQLPPIQLAAKAFDLASETAHPVSSVRIITDVRPIFVESEDSGLALERAILLHVLKLEHPVDSDVFVTLTTDSLRELKKAVDRALKKDELLRRTLSDGLTCLLASEENHHE